MSTRGIRILAAARLVEAGTSPTPWDHHEVGVIKEDAERLAFLSAVVAC
jgi:hypothetical protein